MKPASGKFVVRIDPTLHARLQLMSAESGISINRLCTEQLKTLAGSDASAALSGFHFGIPLKKLKTRLFDTGFRLLGCIVFGSAVRGELTQASDIDLLLILDSGEALTRDLYDQWQKQVEPFLEETVAREVSPQFVSLPTSAETAGGLWYEIAIQGIVLWENGDSVSRFLVGLREWIASGKVLRKLSHGHPYWIKL